MKTLWETAQQIAKREFEQEGISSWDEIDKYEREDRVFEVYERLQKEIGNVKTTSNKKGNDTMKTNKDMRMEKLAQAGIATDNFFDLSMRVPFGAEVKIIVDGKEMIVPATNGGTNLGNGLVNQFADICKMANDAGKIAGWTLNGESNDPIAHGIINDGYVKNSKLFRRWITAQTFRMLNYQSYRNINRKGWEACMKDCFSYEYQFDMTLDELHTLAKLQKEDPQYFAERTMFFNGDVVITLLEDYLRRLKKYVNKQTKENPRNYRKQPYVKLAKYGNVLVKDLDREVYAKIRCGITYVRESVSANDYALIEKRFKDFMSKYYNKLPYETTKCAEWKDAFKGSGAYYTLQNLIRFHNVILRGWTNKYESETYLNALLYGEYKYNVWKFHQLLVDTIDYNDFDLKKSIANGNKAPGTKSDKAERYIRNTRNGR